MKKLLLPLLLLSSCQVLRLPPDPKEKQAVIIREILTPGSSLAWPIRDRRATAVGVQPVGLDTLLWARDWWGNIAEEFNIGDTVEVVLFHTQINN